MNYKSKVILHFSKMTLLFYNLSVETIKLFLINLCNYEVKYLYKSATSFESFSKMKN